MAGVLAAAVIVLLLVIVFFYGGFGNNGNKQLGGETLAPRADQKGLTVPGLVRYKALDDNCRENLGQIRSSIMVSGATSPDEPHPATLEELHLPADILRCPIDPHEPYTYDPVTGKVKCVHPGHGKF